MSSDPGADNFFGRLRNKLSGDKKEETKDHLEKEIVNLHDSHKIDDKEFSMLEGILEFQGKTAREVMVPRMDAFMVDADVSLQDNLDEILREPYSRVPVYKRDKDKIVGVIHIRSVLRMAKRKGFENLNYEDVMTEPLFAPETAELGDLLMEMQQTQRQLAILMDEYGGVTGLATIEDLVEEIVGDIDDEVDHTEVLYNQIAPHKYIIYGKMPLDEFNEQFDAHLEMEDVDTVAGYVINTLKVIPAKGEKLTVDIGDGKTLTTTRMKGSRLLTVLLSDDGVKKEEDKKD